jgi:hypothetical protein
MPKPVTPTPSLRCHFCEMQRLRAVFALAADKLVVSGPGYQCTFQITGWRWVILLTGLALGAVALAVFLMS